MARPLSLGIVLTLAVLFDPGGDAAASSPAKGDTLSCKLELAGNAYDGACEIPCRVNALAVDIDGPKSGFSCDAPHRRVPVTLRKTDTGDDWLGTMEGKHPEDPTRFGMILGKDGKPGVAKTPFGWFQLREAKLEGTGMTLAIDAGRQLPPTSDDLKIIQRALQLLSDTSMWNKNDDRNCPPNPQRWSLFCALMQATTEVSGGVHYRQPALQAVREVLNEVGGNRVSKHRLMDYNNHPDTTLAEIHDLLRTSQSRLERRFR